MTRSGTPDGFQRLYCTEHGRLLSYFRKRVGREEAPDLAQEVFTRLLRSGALERVENPSAYLSRCAQNLLIERWGKKRREQSVLFPFDDERDAPLPPEQTWRIEEADARRIYRRALLAMPRRTRRIFLMHRLTGMTQRQIAKQVGIGEQSVAYHMMRAVTQCRKAASRSD